MASLKQTVLALSYIISMLPINTALLKHGSYTISKMAIDLASLQQIFYNICCVHRYGAAETDCTEAIALDPTYIKAFLRRGAARLGLKKYSDALNDFQQVLKLEPNNKQARTEVEHIQRVCSFSHINSFINFLHHVLG